MKPNAILDGWAAGQRVKDIARWLGLEHRDVQAAILRARKRGDPRAAKRRTLKERRGELAVYAASGETLAQIGARFGVSKQAIWHHLRRPRA